MRLVKGGQIECNVKENYLGNIAGVDPENSVMGGRDLHA